MTALPDISCRRQHALRYFEATAAAGRIVPTAPTAAANVLRFRSMEINQIKRFIKELEERTNSLRGYL
jgi:hypothetical protein